MTVSDLSNLQFLSQRKLQALSKGLNRETWYDLVRMRNACYSKDFKRTRIDAADVALCQRWEKTRTGRRSASFLDAQKLWCPAQTWRSRCSSGAVPASSESSEVIVPTNAGPEDVIMHRESGGLGGLYQAW